MSGEIGKVIINGEVKNNYAGQVDLTVETLIKITDRMAADPSQIMRIKNRIQKVIELFIYNPSELQPLHLAKLIKNICVFEYSLQLDFKKWLQLIPLLNNCISFANGRVSEMENE